MAFSFGTPTSTPGFGAPAASAPAASTGFSFGAAPAASSAGFSFGGAAPATSTPAFGAPAATSTPAFSFSSAPAFGAAAPTSTPAFGAAASTPAFSLGGASTTPGLFGQQQPAASQPAFGAAFGQPAQQQQVQQQQQQAPFTRATKFEELDAGTREKLQQIQEHISKYTSDLQKLTQLPHLQDNAALKQDLDADTSSVSGELRLLQAKISAEQDALEDFREKAIRLLKATETVVRTYERTKLWRDATNGYYRNEPLKPAQQELLSQPVMLPGPFLEEAVAGCSANVAEYSRLLDEVEQVLASSSTQDGPHGEPDVVTALPNIVANLHDYFIAVAAKLERTHTAVQKQKAAYLARLRAQGITTDPFERLRRHEQHQQHQQQQQRLAAAAAGMQQLSGHTPGVLGGALPPAAGASPAGGLLFGASPQAATPAPAAQQAAQGFGGAPFGSPFPTTTPFGGGASANGSLSRSNSKARSSKKR